MQLSPTLKLTLKHKTDSPRSSKQGYQWPHKLTDIIRFFKKIKVHHFEPKDTTYFWSLPNLTDLATHFFSSS